MFGSLGPLEISLIVAVVVLLFGVGKFAGLGKDLGSSIKEFRKAVKDDDGEDEKTVVTTTRVETPTTPAQPAEKPKQNLF